MPVGLLGRMAMPWIASSPCCGEQHRGVILLTHAGAAGNDDDVGVVLHGGENGRGIVGDEVVAGEREALASRKGCVSMGRPPSRATSAASIGPLASAILTSSGGEPAGSSSLPVMTIRTRGRRMTSTSPNPMDDNTPHVLRSQHATVR